MPRGLSVLHLELESKLHLELESKLFPTRTTANARARSWIYSAKKTTGFLRYHNGDPFEITHATVVGILNKKGLRTLHGKEWNTSRVRGPLKKARVLLRAEEEAEMRKLPHFGMF